MRSRTTVHPTVPFLVFLGVLLLSFVIFVFQTQKTQQLVSRAAGPYPTATPILGGGGGGGGSCTFPCAAPACNDGTTGSRFCGDAGVGQGKTCNEQQDEWCRNNGHEGQTPCYIAGTCGTGGSGGGGGTGGGGTGGSTGTPTPTPTLTPAQVIANPPAWLNLIPANLRNYLELLYLWIFVYNRPTDMKYLIDDVIPSPTPSPAAAAATPTPTTANQADKYWVHDGRCVPDPNGVAKAACELLIVTITPPAQ